MPDAVPQDPADTAEALAAECLRVISHLNGGDTSNAIPTHFHEWRRCARRAGLRLLFVRVPSCTRFRGVLIGDIAVIAYRSRRDRMIPVIAHELAEHILRNDGFAPERFSPGVRRHAVAQRVAQRALHV